MNRKHLGKPVFGWHYPSFSKKMEILRCKEIILRNQEIGENKFLPHDITADRPYIPKHFLLFFFFYKKMRSTTGFNNNEIRKNYKDIFGSVYCLEYMRKSAN